MRLSAEQALHAHEYLQKKGLEPVGLPTAAFVTTDVIERALGRIACTPDPRPDRVAEARTSLVEHPPTSAEVADSILRRALADSLR